MALTVVDHPLVADRILTLRDRHTESVDFRRITREVASFLAYEATRDLPLEDDEVTTPLGLVARGRRPAVPGPLVVPILRAGLGLLDGVLAALPDAEVGVIGLKRDEATHRPVTYLERLPDDLTGRDGYIVDPMLATGGSLVSACEMLRARGCRRITALCLIAAPEGVERVRAADPDVRVFTAALDDGLNEHAFIVPGLGDAGDRLYGAGSA
ncbi:MAG: uracil phosphoribosyltransferase [Acidimicrobiia bacterium]|jgi:uracil phosphoribosyltransferase|nr:MAG: uracil phosphoribosyltransferase [Acidimicrobiia bacterium]